MILRGMQITSKTGLRTLGRQGIDYLDAVGNFSMKGSRMKVKDAERRQTWKSRRRLDRGRKKERRKNVDVDIVLGFQI